METGSNPLLVPLATCSDPRAGGKAVHLSKLSSTGLRVPDGFVLIGASPGNLPAAIDDAYARLGGPVAVRSSAMGEDSADTSFAGQYDTFLGIEGTDAVKQAVERCLASARAARAEAYRGVVGAVKDIEMSVIVQRMVAPSAAGVLFTRDPVTGAQDRFVIEATKGLGDALVSGHVAAHRLIISRDGAVLSNETQGAEVCIDPEMAAKLVRDAIIAETHFGHPLDMEWAIDGEGNIHWLQARPITTTNLPGIDELDTPLADIEKRSFTTYNVSEVLPGAVTPLGFSTMGHATGLAIRESFTRYGIPRNVIEGESVVAMFSGHLFLDLNVMNIIPLYVAGATKEGLDFALAGHSLDPIELGPPMPKHTRLFNAVRYFTSLTKASKRLELFAAATASFTIPKSSDPRTQYQNICNALPTIMESLDVHVHASSLSGGAQSALFRVLTDDGPVMTEHQALVSRLLAFVDAQDGDAASSSLALSQAFDRMVATIAKHPEEATRIGNSSVDEALTFLRTESKPAVREAFEAFLRDHGHRCVRELEIRQADWQEDPRPLVSNVQAMLASRKTMPERKREADTSLPPMPLFKRLMTERLVKSSRDSLVLRERSKSHCVRMVRQLRPAYLHLAQMLVEKNILPDTDAIFFFTHQELGKLVDTADPTLVRKALHRRRLLPQQAALEFPRVCKGKPKPIEPSADTSGSSEVMNGTPVSRGVVVGLARVARSPDEAKAIEPGEILVVPYTDVGWAPYFLRAAGLASEIGGTLSHGAVVARECGLPAVVNLPGATKRFRTGDKIRLDGNTGEVRLLARAAESSVE